MNLDAKRQELQRQQCLTDWCERRTDAAAGALTNALNALAEHEAIAGMVDSQYRSTATRAHENFWNLALETVVRRAELSALQEAIAREESARKAAEPQRVPAGARFTPEQVEVSIGGNVLEPLANEGEAT